MSNVIGIIGRRGAGKSTLANAFKSALGDSDVHIVGFADALRDELCDLIWAGTDGDMNVNRTDIDAEKATLYGTGLQWWGEFRRQKYGLDYWVKRWQATVADDGNSFIIAPDTRYENEAAAIRALGGIIVLAERDVDVIGDTRTMDHPSEQGYKTLDADFVWTNNGTPQSARKAAELIIQEIVKRRVSVAA